jgi:hypothetical protein
VHEVTPGLIVVWIPIV